jgi:hypothetical protein
MSRVSRLFLVTVFSFAFLTNGVLAEPDRPVIVIPGLLGSKLCERTSGKLVWGTKWSLSNFSELALPFNYDPNNLPHVPCGLIEAVNILGPWQIHQYDDLVKTLEGLGYQNGKNLFLFDYDWRLTSRQSARRLDDFIQKYVPSGKVDVVAHSMGGLIAKIWLAELGGNQRISWLVTLGTPFLGSAATFKTLDEGWGFWKNLAAHGLGTVRETAMTFPSLYELLPAYGRCCGFPSSGPQPTFFDPFALASWQRFKWAPQRFTSADGQAWLGQTLADAKAIARLEIPSGTHVISIVTSLIPTAWRVLFDPEDGHVLDYIPLPGDGTVYQNSAANNRLRDARPSLTNHQTIFADDASRQVLRWALIGGAEPTKGVLADIQARLRSKTGDFVDISAVSAELKPNVLAPGSQGDFVVELHGLKELTGADLTNIQAFRDTTPSVVLDPPTREVEQDAAGNVVVRLLFRFNAPAEPGSFSANVYLPGVTILSDTGVVVPQ